MGTLRNLVVVEGSLCDQGANPEAHIMITKRREPMPLSVRKDHIDNILSKMNPDDRVVLQSALEVAAIHKASPEPEVTKSAREMELEKQVQTLQRNADITNIRKQMADMQLPAHVIDKYAERALAEGEGSRGLCMEILKTWGAERTVAATLVAQTNGSSIAEGRSALEQAEALAQEMVAKNHGMTLQTALAKTWEANPSLYKQYREERNT